MIRAVALVALLAGCSAPVPPTFPACPTSVRVPASLPRNPTRAQADALEIRVELAREAERERGDACAAAAAAMRAWIGGRN